MRYSDNITWYFHICINIIILVSVFWKKWTLTRNKNVRGFLVFIFSVLVESRGWWKSIDCSYYYVYLILQLFVNSRWRKLFRFISSHIVLCRKMCVLCAFGVFHWNNEFIDRNEDIIQKVWVSSMEYR